MPQILQYEAAKQLIDSFLGNFKKGNHKVKGLESFISALETIDFSLVHKNKDKKLLPELEVTLLALPSYDLKRSGIEGLSVNTFVKFNWFHVYNKIDLETTYTKGMFASRLLGLDGYYAHDRLSVGQMLLMPGVIYPFHTHQVEELYYCLSGKLIIQHNIDGKQFVLEPGELSITPKGTLHSLEVSGSKPVLLMYSWFGNLKAPIWIWKKIEDSSWQGANWTRLPGQSWIITEKKEVSNRDFWATHKKPS